MRYLPYHGNRTPSEDRTRDAAEYRARWEARTGVPYGYCWCGCGERTVLAVSTDAEGAAVRGEPQRYKHGHRARLQDLDPKIRAEYRRRWEEETTVPYGLCWCGCGRRTRPAPQSVTEYGHVRGEPVRYVAGHSTGYTDPETERAICDRYETDADVGRIAATFGVHESTAYDVLRRNGVSLRGRNIPTRAQEEAIRRGYLDGKSGTLLAREWGFGKSTVKRVLGRANVVRTASEAHRTHTCDDHYFDVIDSEEKAYWLGFIGADGCVTGRNTLSVGLQARDREHLERLRVALRATNPVGSGRSSNGFPTATFLVTSPALTAGLLRNGVERRKSKTHGWPHHLDPFLLRHYLRGYSDGDGWFSVATSGYVRKSDGRRGSTLNWGIIGTDDFCADAQDFLIREVSVRRVGLHPHWATAGMSTLTYGGNLQVGRIYRLLYDGASVWLPRKRDTAQPHVRDGRQARPRPDARALSDAGLEEAARLRATGLSYDAIGRRLDVSGSTVRNTLTRGYRPLP